MTSRLLQRQVRLLEYLTSGDAIFGEHRDNTAEAASLGIDSGLLRLEARFSHEKRMQQITGVFSRTFELLGAAAGTIIREFVDACPQASISRIETARQFYEFLAARWRKNSPQPPHLPDIAACEFACAKVCADADDRRPEPENQEHKPRCGVRRPRGVVLLRCDYDIRQIFEEGLQGAAPDRRDTLLAVALPPGVIESKVFELRPVLFDVLTALDDWTDPAAIRELPESDELIADLRKYGLLEVRT
jgi:hypothetical protein